MQIGASYTAKNLWCKVTVNNGTQTFTDRKNAANGGQSISIAATGTFEDTTGTTSLAAGNDYCKRLVVGGSHNNTCTLTLSSVLLDDGGTAAPPMGAWPTSTSANSGTGIIFGWQGVAISSPNDYRMKLTYAGSFTRLGINVTLSSTTNTTTITLLINGSGATNTISLAAATTGVFEDTTPHTDSFNSGDDIQVFWSAEGTGNLTLGMWMTGTATANTLVVLGAGATTTNYLLNGTLNSTTESDVQVKARVADAFRNGNAKVVSNTRDGATTITFRANGASPGGGPVITIPASSTGDFTDTTGAYTTATTDTINWRETLAGTTGTQNITGISIQQGTVAVAAVIPDVIKAPLVQLPQFIR
jgi:hypothetical protein